MKQSAAQGSWLEQYSSKGAQTANYEITGGIDNEWAITIDSLDDLYVSNNFVNVAVDALADAAVPVIKTINPGAPAVYGTATQGPAFAYGSTTFFESGFITELRVGDGFNAVGNVDEALAMAFGKAGTLYVANANGTVDVWAGSGSQLLQLSFAPEGIAVDAVRGRIYLSNQQGNQIAV